MATVYYERKKVIPSGELTFQALEWLDFNEYPDCNDDMDVDSDNETCYFSQVENKDNEKYIIRIFGSSKNGESVCLNVENFTPFFFIKVDIKSGQNPDTLSGFIINILKKQLKNVKTKEDGVWKTYDYSGCFVENACKIQEKYDFYGFSNKKKYKFLRLVFSNSNAMKKCITIIKNNNSAKKSVSGLCKLPLYEANLDSVIRFAHIQNLNFAGWVNITSPEYISQEFSKSHCQIEASVDWRVVNPLDNNANAPILQASYDIETYSIDGKFPSPNVPGNVITQIATSFKYFGSSEFLLKHIIVLKKCSELSQTDDVPKILECYDTEEEVLMAWKRLIVKMDPDILYQYNGDQFDCNYIYTRAIKTGCSDFFLNGLGKLKNTVSVLAENNFSSSAYGSSNFKRLTMPGRINFDILIYIKREYKENSYKLDYIAEKYVGQNKNPVTAQMMFKFFEEGDPDKIKIVAEYCLVDTVLPQKLVDKLHILQNQISMGNVCSVPIRYLIERGQQIKVFSQILKETRKQNFLVPTIENAYSDVAQDEEEDSFTGATVLPPLKGAYFEPVTVCDFASLYPSIIRAHNLCFSTIVLDPKFEEIKGVEYKTFEWKDGDVAHSFKYSQSTEGILPKLLSELSFARKDYKKLMKTTSDPFLVEVYNKCQLAVKVSMNSIYGFLAAPMLKCKPIAATVTAIGRNMIEDTKKFMEENYAKSISVYGDTDSVFIKFVTDTTKAYSNSFKKYQENPTEQNRLDYHTLKTKCIKESIELGKIAAKNATKNLFVDPVNLEYEKVYCPLLLLSKKRYIGVLYSENPENPDYRDNKGVVLKRRDNFELLKKIYSTVIDNIMESGHKGVDSSKEYIEDCLNKIVNNQYENLDDFVISKLLKDTYKSTNIPHLVLANKLRRRDPGNAPKSNDRVPYVFTYPDPSTTIGKKLIKDIQEDREKEFIEKVSKNHGKKIISLEEAIKINKTLEKRVILKKTAKYSQYEKVEDPDYMIKNKLPLDAEYYITFMKTSICEILCLFMENPEKIFDDIVEEYRQSRW